MDVNDRLTRLEDALTDLAIVMTEGDLTRLSAHTSAEVIVAGTRFQTFHREVLSERSS